MTKISFHSNLWGRTLRECGFIARSSGVPPNCLKYGREGGEEDLATLLVEVPGVKKSKQKAQVSTAQVGSEYITFSAVRHQC